VLDQADLRERIVGEALPDAVSTLVETHCVSEYSEEWDLDGLLTEVKVFWPSELTTEQLRAAGSTNELYELLMDEALAFYERRETELTPPIMRQVERQVVLSIIDQRWRAHLYEMDYLREGINLRAMGQKDPLVEWQREGFDMFGQMMHGIWQDVIQFVMKVDVKVNRPAAAGAPAGGDGAPPADAPRDGSAATVGLGAAPADDGLRDVKYSSPDDESIGGADRISAAARAEAAASGEPAPAAGDGRGGAATATATQTNTPIVKSEWDKTPRNAPCPCGSGKKYKLCHGR
jgi:preprotein translocase subunit SecA